jgi:hypothetical protein
MQEWRVDPFGRYRHRLFVDGVPTATVDTGTGATAVDPLGTTPNPPPSPTGYPQSPAPAILHTNTLTAPVPVTKSRSIAPVVLIVAIIAVLILGGLGIAGWVSQQNSHDYPASVEQNFLDGCERGSNGQTGACECSLHKLEQHYKLNEFVALDQQVRNGQPLPPDAVAILLSCRAST